MLYEQQCVTLGDLKKFIEEFKNVPDNTIVSVPLIGYTDSGYDPIEPNWENIYPYCYADAVGLTFISARDPKLSRIHIVSKFPDSVRIQVIDNEPIINPQPTGFRWSNFWKR